MVVQRATSGEGTGGGGLIAALGLIMIHNPIPLKMAKVRVAWWLFAELQRLRIVLALWVVVWWCGCMQAEFDLGAGCVKPLRVLVACELCL
jgi:hypothetical protein